MATASRKRTSKKKKPVKRRARKKSVAAKSNGAGHDTGPIEQKIKSDVLRYKLKALHLEWEREDVRVRSEVQQKLDDLLARARRNDAAWKKANKARVDATNEFIKEFTEELPSGYAIQKIELTNGTYRSAYDPENRGKKVLQ